MGFTTSVLLSLYCGDDLSEIATQWFDSLAERICWTGLHSLEFTAGLEARVCREQTDRGTADSIYLELAKHRSAFGYLVEIQPTDWTDVLKKGADLARSQGAQFQSRSLDVLHVASCLELGFEEFWTLDRRQSKLALASGLRVKSLPEPR